MVFFRFRRSLALVQFVEPSKTRKMARRSRRNLLIGYAGESLEIAALTAPRSILNPERG
jgi:hypothetical protein